MRHWIIVLSVTCSCVSSRTYEFLDSTFERSSAFLERAAAEVPESESLDRDAFVRASIAREPALIALAYRARAKVLAARASTALPPPEVDVQLWNVPAARPYEVGEADMLMIELRQTFANSSGRDARARVQAHEAQALLQTLRAEERRVAREAAVTYARYQHAIAALDLHAAHQSLLDQMLEAARARYSTGAASLSELARIQLDASQVRREMARYESERLQAQSEINTRLGRALEQPIRLRSQRGESVDAPSLAASLTLAHQNRARFSEAQANLHAAEAGRDEAESMRSPEFTVGVGYWQDPNGEPGLGASVSVSLPFLSGRARHEVQRARAEIDASNASTAQVELDVRLEILRAHSAFRGVQSELEIIDRDSFPAAARAKEAARASFTAGGDTLVLWLDATRMELELAIAKNDLQLARADAIAMLEEAIGVALPVMVTGTGTVTVAR